MIFGIPTEAIRQAIILPAWALTWYSTMFGAAIVPIGIVIATVIERYRHNRQAKYFPAIAEFRRGSGEPRDLRRSDLHRTSAEAAALMPVLMLVAVAFNQVYWMWVIHAASIIVCLIWWGRLRRDGVRHAEVWATCAWFMPRLVWAIYAAGYGLVQDGAFYADFGDGDESDEVLWPTLFGGISTFVAVLIGTATLLVAWLRSALRHTTRTKPIWLATLLIPCAVYFAYSEPVGHSHIVFGLIAVGYAISTEMRRCDVRDYAPLRDFRWRKQAVWALVIAVTIVGAASLLVNVTYTVQVFRGMVEFGLELYVILIVPAVIFGTLGMVTAAWAYRAGNALRYGAVAMGVGAMLPLALTFNLTSDPDQTGVWSLPAYTATATVALTVVLTMWYVFGPGALALEGTGASTRVISK